MNTTQTKTHKRINVSLPQDTIAYDDRLYPTEVLIEAKEGGLSADSVVLLNQIRSIDKQRLIKKLRRVKPHTMARIIQALLISCGLIDI